MIDTTQVACAIDLPHTRSLAAVLLMRDGTYKTDPALTPAARRAAHSWINQHGAQFRAANHDLLENP